MTSVRSLNDTVGLLGGGVDGLQRRPVERGERLHRRAHHQQLTGGDAALGAAGEGAAAAVLVGVGVPRDRVVGHASPSAGDLEPVADLDALDGLDAHDRLGEQRVELAVPVHVAAEADRHAVAEHLDDAAERVAVLGRGLDLGRSSPRSASVSKQRTWLSSTRSSWSGVGRTAPAGTRAAPIWMTWEMISMPSVRQQRLGHGAGGDTGRGLAGARPLEHVAGVGEAVLLHAGEVGVARAHLGERILGGAGRRAHLLVPLVAAEPLAVLDLDRDRRSERAAVADAADERELVGLEALPGARP